MRNAVVLVAMLAAPAFADDKSPPKPDEDPEPKLSLPTEADRLAWQRSGFRFSLGAVGGQFSGANGAPSGRLIGATIRAGVRLDPTWSILASIEYASVYRADNLNGFRYYGTIDPTYHATPNLALAVGFGFGGIVEGDTGRPDPEPLPNKLDVSYTFPDAHAPVASCHGLGAAGLVRGEWSMVLGPRTSTAIALEVDAQWTACTDETGNIDTDNGTQIVRRQYWAHTGVTLGWSLMWR